MQIQNGTYMYICCTIRYHPPSSETPMQIALGQFAFPLNRGGNFWNVEFSMCDESMPTHRIPSMAPSVM